MSGISTGSDGIPCSGDVETVDDDDGDASCISTGNKQKSCFVSDLAST